MYYKNQIVQYNDTFFEKNVLPGDVFLAAGKGKRDVLRWKRYDKIANDKFILSSKSNADALRFKAHRDIYWCGFLWTQEY